MILGAKKIMGKNKSARLLVMTPASLRTINARDIFKHHHNFQHNCMVITLITMTYNLVNSHLLYWKILQLQGILHYNIFKSLQLLSFDSTNHQTLNFDHDPFSVNPYLIKRNKLLEVDPNFVKNQTFIKPCTIQCQPLHKC